MRHTSPGTVTEGGLAAPLGARGGPVGGGRGDAGRGAGTGGQAEPPGVPVDRRALAGTVAAAILFVALAATYTTHTAVTVDERAMTWAAGLPGWAYDVALAVGALGGRVVLAVLVGGGFAVLVALRRRTDAVFLAVAAGGSDLVLHLLKLLLDRERAGEGTSLPAGSAFPGGHGTTAVTAYLAVALLAYGLCESRFAQRALIGGTVALAAAIGASQVVLGRRTAVEITAGLLLGLAWFGACVVARSTLVSVRPRRTLALAAVASLGLIGLQAVAAGYTRDPFSGWDRSIALKVAESIPGWVEWSARLVTWGGGGAGMAAVAVGAAAYLRGRPPTAAAAWAPLAPLLAYALAQGLAHAVKAATDRPRPGFRNAVDLPSTASFPSGHATAAVAVLGTLAALTGRPRSAAALLVVAVAIGTSRVLLGVHWTTDVAGGFALGLFCAAVVVLGLDLRRRRSFD